MGGVIRFLPYAKIRICAPCTFPIDFDFCGCACCACCPAWCLPETSQNAMDLNQGRKLQAQRGGQIGPKLSHTALATKSCQKRTPLWRKTLNRDHDPSADPTQACGRNRAFPTNALGNTHFSLEHTSVASLTGSQTGIIWIPVKFWRGLGETAKNALHPGLLL